MFAGHAMSVSALAFASDAIRIASGSWDDKVLVWDSVTGLQLGVYGGHSESVHAIAFSPETRTLAVMSGGGELRLWNLATDREAGIFQLDRGTGMGSVQFSPKGTWLAAVSPPGRLTLLAAPKLSEEGK
jgi:WD40 repeat protein